MRLALKTAGKICRWLLPCHANDKECGEGLLEVNYNSVLCFMYL